MSNDHRKDLLDLYRQAGVSSSVDFWDEPDARSAAAEVLVNLLDEAAQNHASKFRSVVPASRPPSLETLVEMYNDNPHKAKVFLQALDSASTPDMLVMVWQILMGDSIKSVDMKYEEGGAFRLEVVLEDCVTGNLSRYESRSLDDAALVRHFGIMKMGDHWLFDGFYALTG
jgi:hypothetical protein